MTFQEAKDRLAQISGGRYRALYYTLTIGVDGSERAACRLYIDAGVSHDETRTWEAAFAALEEEMNPSKCVAPTDEQPK